MEISKINVNGTSYDIQDSRVGTTVPSNAVFTDTTYTAGTGINISNGLISVDNSVYTTSNAPTDTNTTYSLTINGTTNGDSNGTSLGTVYAPTTTGTSGQVWKSNGSGGEWGTVSISPAYSNVSYTATAVNGSGALTLAGTDPIYVVTATANISSVTFTANPSAGHSCHVLFTAASEYTVTIGHDATNRVCPNAEDLSLTIPAGGYVEVDFLNANNKVYVRGV